MSTERYDIILFGPTGFTGTFTVEELANAAAESAEDREGRLTWALAGRNRAKIEAVLAKTSKIVGRDLSEEAGILVVDNDDETAVRDMCSRARCIISCVQPYRIYADVVMQACIDYKTDYVDMCSIEGVVENTLKKFHKPALEAGIHIVQTVAYDSVPADFGVAFTIDNFPGFCTQIESFNFIDAPGWLGPHGHSGTFHSMLHGLSTPEEFEAQFRPKPREPVTFYGPTLRRRPIFYSSDNSSWAALSPTSDTCVVQRTQVSRDRKGQHAVQYIAFMEPENIFTIIGLIIFVAILYLLTRFKFGVNFAYNHPTLLSLGFFDSDGPSRDHQMNTKMILTFRAKGYKSKAEALKKGPHTVKFATISKSIGGYYASGTIIVQAAVTLLREKSKLKTKGGVYTPVIAFEGSDYLSRLQKHRIEFNVLPGQKS